MKNEPLFETKEWPSSRNVVLDGAYFASRRHLVHALIEVDVTDVRRVIHERKVRSQSNALACQEITHLIAHVEQPRKDLEAPTPIEPSISTTEHTSAKEDWLSSGSPVSFTAFILKCVGEAVALHPMLQAYRSFWGTKLIIPKPVDVATMIEVSKDGVAIPEIIRNVQDKSVYEISEEIRAVQSNSKKEERRLFNWGGSVPTFLRRLFFWVILCRPKWICKMMGTVAASSMGMFGKDDGSHKNGGSSFAIGYLPFHTMGVFVGGIATRPCLVPATSSSYMGHSDVSDENFVPSVSSPLQEREYLSLTITFDHDIVDGAPAARFSNTLRHLIETGTQFL